MSARVACSVSWTLLVIATAGPSAAASAGAGQPVPTPDQIELRDAVRDRFDVVALLDGIGLVSRDAAARVIQLSGDVVAVDGRAVSDRELRGLLGRDARLVRRVAGLEPDVRRRLFRLGDEAAPAVEGAARRESASVPSSPSLESPRSPPRTYDSIFRIGGSLAVAEHERVDGDVVTVGGLHRIDGEVAGNVVLIGGATSFGPRARVGGHVTAFGGVVERAPTADLGRGLDQIDVGEWFRGDPREPAPSAAREPRRAARSRADDFTGTVLRLLGLALLSTLVVAVGRGGVERVAHRARLEPIKAGIVGLLAQVIFVPLVVAAALLLVVSIVGIPFLLLMPFVLLAAGVVMVVGFTAIVHGIGTWFSDRVGHRGPAPFIGVWVGIALLLALATASESLTAVGAFGRLLAPLFALTALGVEYAAWTAGLGALILDRWDALPAASGRARGLGGSQHP